MHMRQGTSRPESSPIGQDSGKLQSSTSIFGLAPAAKPDSSVIQECKPVELVTLYHCIERPKPITRWKSDSDEDMMTAPVSAEE